MKDQYMHESTIGLCLLSLKQAPQKILTTKQVAE
jgi:hypothetical protein